MTLEKWDHNKIEEVSLGKALTQMIYTVFWYDGQSELIAIERDPLVQKHGYSTWSYIWALEEGLILIYKPLDVYQMDNTPIHNSNLVKEWLETHGIWTLKFPPYSPDLNPIENLWWALKKKIIELHPELEWMGRSHEDLDCLIEACKEAWMALD